MHWSTLARRDGVGGCRFDTADCREEVRVEWLSTGVGHVMVKFVVRLATGTWIHVI